MSKEDVYDAEVAPLMTRIIAICKEHDIPMIASFELDDDRDAEPREMRGCSTVILPSNAAGSLHRAASHIVRG